MMSFRGPTSWANMTSPGGKLTALACHPTKQVNKAKQLTCLSINMDLNFGLLVVGTNVCKEIG